MKKVISGALAAAIITSNLPLRVLAEEVNPIVDSADPNQESAVERKGYIEVDINLDMPIYNNKGREKGINVTLKTNGVETVVVDGSKLNGTFGDGSSYTVESLGLGRNTEIGNDGKVYAYRVTFKDLPAGTENKYKIALGGYGFSNVESNDIEINNYSKRIVVNNAGKSRDTESESLLPIGDVNHDGTVDYNDYNAVFDDLGSSMDRESDLNRDRIVDIADLQYVHNNMGRKATENLRAEDTNFILDSKIIENMEATSKDGEVKGTINDILDDSESGALTITPNNGQISSDNPVSLDLNLNKTSNEEQPEISMQYLSIVGNINSGSILIGDEEINFDKNGNIKENSNARTKQATERIVKTDENKNNNIVINLGKQVAVSKITIKVTGSDDRNLAKIAKVEFLNNIYKEIPKPDIKKPEITSVTTSTATGSEHIGLTWKCEDSNITGYELKVEEIDTNGNVRGAAKKFRMSENNFKISGVKPYSNYRLSVQALNGKWESGYNELKEEDKAKIDNVDINNNYNPVTDEEFKKRGKDGIVNIAVIPNEAPTPPEGIKAEGKYKSIDLSWKNHYAAKEFQVYYRIKGSNSDFKPVSDSTITGTSYTITGLEDNTLYEIQMRAKNHIGWGNMSESVSARTVQAEAPETPNYKLINTISTDNTGKTNNIKDVKYPKITIPEGKENEKIEVGAGTEHIEISKKYAVVDNDYTTYWSVDDWDTGAEYDNRRGPIVEFDFTNKKEYKINKIAVVSRLDGKGTTPEKARVFVYENGETNSKSTVHTASIQNYTDSKQGKYSIIKLNEPITVKEGNLVQVALSTSAHNNPKRTSISELKFYEYDSIEDDINKLFADDLQLVLKEDVTESKISVLRDRLNIKDNGEYHPERDSLNKKLDIALKLLKEAGALDKEVMTMDILINPAGSSAGFVDPGYSNGWQALGLTAKAGDTIKVYLSTDNKGSGPRNVEFAYEQNYAESGSYISKAIALKPGENIIQIDKLVSTDVEKGGNLYVRMKDSPDKRDTVIKIRVSGAERIPHLNLNNKLENVNELVNKKDNNEDKSVKEIKEKLKAYILELKDHVDSLPEKHKQSNIKHEEVGDRDNIYDYNQRTSILNSTNIEGDRFTLTIPATQAYKGLGLSNLTNDNINEKVDKLYDTMLAWEQLMQITNAKKGILEKDNSAGEYNKNKATRHRVNVKYQRMFGSAFMYASGHHVGVEYDSTADFMNGVPYKFENGKVANPGEGYLFGWGISHEIGHKADIGLRTYGETSNNILALITQTFDGVSKSRLELNNIYPRIYKKVTSDSVGVSQDVATLLGMFWQLHLAYEPGYTYEIIDRNNDSDLKNDSYYTKMNRLYRKLSSTEQKLDKDQLLIRKASEAAGKNLTDFFDSWGLKANSDTAKAIENLPKETRKIQYLNDEAYRKRLAGVEDMSNSTKVVASFKDGNIKDTVVNSNSVTLSLNVNNDADKDKILGYEIIRNDGNLPGGENVGTTIKYRPVGFVNANEDGSAEFTDNISPMNNRVVTYKVRAYDYNLNCTEEFEIGSVKLSHDGTLDSSKFLLKSNLISEELIPNENGEVSNSIDQNSELAWKNNDALAKMTDGKSDTAFRGKRMTHNAFDNNSGGSSEDKIDIKADPYIILDLQGSKTICGLKYTKSDNAVSRFSLKRLVNAVKGQTSYTPMSNYKIFISDTGRNNDWKEISKGTFNFEGGNTSKVIFGKYTDEAGHSSTKSYEAKYVKIVADGAKDSNLDIAEISLLGSTGDNIEIRNNGIGKLKEDFVYQKATEGEGGLKEAVIPKDSIIITGEYKGNPAFNIPLMIDENNKTIDGELILMAEPSDDNEVGEVYSGTWIYWIAQNDLSKLSSKVKAELYRYNGLDEAGDVSGGQRLVSDTLYTKVPSADKLPTIEFKSDIKKLARKANKQSVIYMDMRNTNLTKEN